MHKHVTVTTSREGPAPVFLVQPTPVPTGTSEAETPRKRSSLLHLEIVAKRMRTVAINLAFLLACLLLTPVIVSQFWRSAIMIEPISVPDSLAARGLKPDVVANRLWDALQAFARSARTSKASFVAIPNSQRVEFSFPDSGVSIDSLVINLRRFFRLYDRKIGGEFVCADATCALEGRHLRIRIVTSQAEVIDLAPMGRTSEADYFRQAAAGIYGILDPFVAIAALAESEPLQATVLARRLVRGKHADAKWARNLIGNMRLNANDPVAAIEEYRAALLLDPGFQIARGNLGRVLRVMGDLAGAKAAFTEIERRDNGSELAAEGFAELALAAGDQTEAVRQFARAAERDPLNPRFTARAGMVEMKAGRNDDAARYFTRSLELDPGYAAAFAGLATIHLRKGDSLAAERLYRDAADYAPDNAAAQAEDADMLLVTKDFAGTLARANRAIALDPRNAKVRLTRARALQYLTRPTEALQELERAGAIDPASADIASALGDSYRDLGRNPEAIVAYQHFLQLAPKSIMVPVIEGWVTRLKR
jgi:tetratricopeptide (TPR) repeat protein